MKEISFVFLSINVGVLFHLVVERKKKDADVNSVFIFSESGPEAEIPCRKLGRFNDELSLSVPILHLP